MGTPCSFNQSATAEKLGFSMKQAVLISRSLLGEYVRAIGAVARNYDGTPVMRSEPVLNEEEWTKLSEAVASVKYKKRTRALRRRRWA
ncbi:hypothetical protein ABZ092_36930 [Streptomyces bobili]|uniref:hypothetical protein n=1 Tax=Streptomyces bobili TaxID=67280 RepID=UPI0033A05596